MTAAALAAHAKGLARDDGFDLAGVARADAPPDLAFFAEWVARGHAGEMAYLTSQVAKRSDLRAAFPWARSVLCVGLQYDTPHPYSTAAPADRGWISRYAWGDDYHDVMKAMLDRVVAAPAGRGRPVRGPGLRGHRPRRREGVGGGRGPRGVGEERLPAPPRARLVVLPRRDRDRPRPAGGRPAPDICGSCTACLDACPTGALVAPYVLDATRCISYLTIEVKGDVPEDRRAGVGRHVFGCDICQDVCPWNRRRRHHGGAAFEPRPGAEAPDLAELAALDEEAFRERFRRSPVKRAKRRGLLRNVAVALGNSGDAGQRARPRAAGRRRGSGGARARRLGPAAARRAPQFSCRLFLISIL